MTFRIGQKVVCVDDKITTNIPHGITRPQLRSVYTVRAHVVGFNGVTNEPGLLLEEIKNEIGPYGTEYNFRPSRFRPIVERKTDISVFTEMLRTTKAPQLDEVQS